jgi:hypothetical protein
LKISNLDAFYLIWITRNYHKLNFPHSQKISKTHHKTQNKTTSRKQDIKSEDSSYQDDDVGDRKRGTSEMRAQIDDLLKLCAQRDRKIKKLKVELSLSKSQG